MYPYAVIEHSEWADAWVAHDHDARPGKQFWVTFEGPNAEREAREYADWKNSRAQDDRWAKMTDAEKDAEIREAGL